MPKARFKITILKEKAHHIGRAQAILESLIVSLTQKQAQTQPII